MVEKAGWFPADYADFLADRADTDKTERVEKISTPFHACLSNICEICEKICVICGNPDRRTLLPLNLHNPKTLKL